MQAQHLGVQQNLQSIGHVDSGLHCMRLPLQDTLALASRMLPLDAYNRLAHGTFGFLNEWMMNLVTDDAVPAFNMYGLFRLADDLASIQALADASQPAGLAVRTLQATITETDVPSSP